MERPAQRYFCNKCGYVGISDSHQGCHYFAYPMAHLEQLYIDHLEAELEALRASPASVPEGWRVSSEEDQQAIRDGQEADGTNRLYLTVVDGTHSCSIWCWGKTQELANKQAQRIEQLTAAPNPPVTEDRKAVGTAHITPGASGFTMCVFNATDVPVGTVLYTMQEDKSCAK